MKKKSMQDRAVALEDAHGKGATVKRKKSATPYKDPMAGEKLEMLSKIRAQRVALAIEKEEAIKRARYASLFQNGKWVDYASLARTSFGRKNNSYP
jgi:hypothetical protein